MFWNVYWLLIQILLHHLSLSVSAPCYSSSDGLVPCLSVLTVKLKGNHMPLPFNRAWQIQWLGYLHVSATNRMSALPAKPGLRHSVSEWYSNNHQLSATAQHERYVSNVIRQEGRSLRNETNCKVGSCLWGCLRESQTVSVTLYRVKSIP